MKSKVLKEEFEFTREWFMDKDNQVHTIQDVELFNDKECKNIIQIGEHFLLDLIPINNDVEIWEVVNSKRKHYCKERGQWFEFVMLRKITTGKQFGYPNGYWKIKTLNEHLHILKASNLKTKVTRDEIYDVERTIKLLEQGIEQGKAIAREDELEFLKDIDWSDKPFTEVQERIKELEEKQK